ncbi:MAG: ATP synthase subunit I [Candidatus Tenebribacter mawsonii]|nr:ATP synthase subunit I [Candidatus Tenebribacter mawsonii]
MTNNMDNNNRYIRRIMLIILLTNILAILTLPWFFKQSISWILGSLGSAGNFYWLAHNLKKSIELIPTKSRVNSAKGSLTRYAVLTVFALVIFFIVKPNIIIFGVGLLSAQIVIYIVEIVRNLKNNKYFRG